MAIWEPMYLRDITLVKVFGCGESKKIKVITMKTLRNKGIDAKPKKHIDFESENENANDEKLADNVSRAKSKIFELAFCNPWDYFFTATLNPAKYDRSNLEKFHKDVTRFLREYGEEKIDFLLIPELHTDGKSWHMHGFLRGVPFESLKRFQIGDTMGKGIAAKVLKGDTVYNWPAYQEKFGFCDLEPIKNPEAVSKYVTKYISKGLALSVTELNAHLYYHSRGLKFAETIKKGRLSANYLPSYENEYCSVLWCDYTEENLNNILSLFDKDNDKGFAYSCQ